MYFSTSAARNFSSDVSLSSPIIGATSIVRLLSISHFRLATKLSSGVRISLSNSGGIRLSTGMRKIPKLNFFGNALLWVVFIKAEVSSY